MNAQARLGAFVLIALAILILLSSKIGGFQWGTPEGTNIQAIFNDASGISEQTPVLMAGVQIGSVVTVALKNSQALVCLLIQPGIQLPASTRAHIAGGGLVGEKYIALHARAGDKTPLTMPNIPVNEGGDFRDMISRASSLTDHAVSFFNKAEKITNTVDQILIENRQDIRDSTRGLANIISANSDDIRSTTSNLASITQENRQNIHKLMQSLPAAVQTGQQFFNSANIVMRDMHLLVLDNRENLYRAMFELRLASENLEAFTGDIRRNPWKLMKKKAEVKADRRARQRRMEEILMTTGRMGLESEH